jgi:glycosyltransferase involved in cell wall biosynthesis
MSNSQQWAVFQLGSREHYSIPSALASQRLLQSLVTDIWLSPKVLPGSLESLFPKAISRYNSHIPSSLVKSNLIGRSLFESKYLFQSRSSWNIILARNEWFGRWAASHLRKACPNIVFSYSYAARHIFHIAKSHTSSCVLGQIDPGPRELLYVEENTHQYSHLSLPCASPPPSYWSYWQEETYLADYIVVNSSWSRRLLLDAGVPKQKIIIVPLAYETPISFHRSRLSSSSNSLLRLRTLFLGSVILRKGVGHIFDAIRRLKHAPIDFIFAGPVLLKIPPDILSMSNVSFLGPVDILTARSLYANSDVFLFPTISDGFGLSQLEAFAHNLPIIASRNCGSVVTHGYNGLVLDSVTPDTIAESLILLSRDRDMLAFFRANSFLPPANTLNGLASSLALLSSQIIQDSAAAVRPPEV